MTGSKQPDFFFQTFIEAVKPAIKAFAPHACSSWTVPYCHLLGMKDGTVRNWRSWRKLPNNAFQNASNILALQEIALLDAPGATLEDAKAIARARLVDALSDMPEPKASALPADIVVDIPPPRGEVHEQNVQAVLTYHAEGLAPVDIAAKTGLHFRTVTRMLKDHLGDQMQKQPRIRWDTEAAQRWRNQGVPVTEIADRVGQRPRTVWEFFSRQRQTELA